MGRRARWGVGLGIVLVLALVAVPLSLAGAQPDGECPEGTEFLVKFEWKGNSFEPEGGDSKGVTITNVRTDQDGEPRGFDFTSVTPIAAIFVKTGGGEFTKEFDPPANSGSFDLPAEHQNAISHVTFCVPSAQPSPSPSPSPSPTESPSPSPSPTESPSPSPSPTESPSPSPSPTVGGRIVTPPPPGAQPPDQVAGRQVLAVTGAQLALMVLMAGALLLLGATLIYSARRRSRQQKG